MAFVSLIACLPLALGSQTQHSQYDESGIAALSEALVADNQCEGDCALAALQLNAARSSSPKKGCSEGKCDCAEQFLPAFESVDRESATFAQDVHKALEGNGLGTALAAQCAQKLQDQLEPAGLAVGGGYGVNAETGWEYSLVDDCFRNSGKCPEGQYCQTFSREQWFPYAESYINRGRCVQYKTSGMLCTGDTSDELLFGEHANWARPPMMCGPGLACAKEQPHYPGPMCVKVKSPVYPCTQAWPFCGGRPSPSVKGGEIDWQKWSDSPACASNVTCRTPLKGGFTRKMMEVCSSKYLVYGLNGEQFAFLGTERTVKALGSRSATMGALQDELEHNDLSADGKVDADTKSASVGLMDMAIQNKTMLSDFLNKALEPLWPYPVCKKGQSDDCTEFPLRKFTAEESEAAIGKHPSSYFCMWGVPHTIFENGHTYLSSEQQHASHRLIQLYVEGHSCQVCRTNFDHIVKHYGNPDSDLRANHADWWWKAHNAANEHVYSVHSYPSVFAPRVGDFANPVHMSAWYTSREVARDTWKIKD